MNNDPIHNHRQKAYIFRLYLNSMRAHDSIALHVVFVYEIFRTFKTNSHIANGCGQLSPI